VVLPKDLEKLMEQEFSFLTGANIMMKDLILMLKRGQSNLKHVLKKLFKIFGATILLAHLPKWAKRTPHGPIANLISMQTYMRA